MDKQAFKAVGNANDADDAIVPKMEKRAWTPPTLKSEPIGGATQSIKPEAKAKVAFGHDALLFGS